MNDQWDNIINNWAKTYKVSYCETVEIKKKYGFSMKLKYMFQHKDYKLHVIRFYYETAEVGILYMIKINLKQEGLGYFITTKIIAFDPTDDDEYIYVDTKPEDDARIEHLKREALEVVKEMPEHRLHMLFGN